MSLSLPESQTKPSSHQTYAWQRLFARMIDYQISSLILSGLILYTRLVPDVVINAIYDPKAPPVMTAMVFSFFSTALWVVLESLLLIRFQTTLGKALFRLKLKGGQSSYDYWKRSFAVWAVGMGLGIPFISTFANIISVIRLKKSGITDWDRWVDCKVESEAIGLNRLVAAVVLIALIMVNRVAFLSGSSVSLPQNISTREQNQGKPLTEASSSQTKEISPQDKWLTLQKEAEAGSAEAQNNLGNMYANGQGFPNDDVKAVEWYQKAAVQGLAEAQFNLGFMYANGQGVLKDKAKAVEWYQKAAVQGLAVAQNDLGAMYDNGQGVSKDETKAVEWYQKAALQGYADAQTNLGAMYAHGKGVPKDDVKAVEWYQKAADQGFAGAQAILGYWYTIGRGVLKDDAKAVVWYQKAADQGHDVAQNNLGVMYAHGRGVPKDDTKAVEWYQKAASQGFAGAQVTLGYWYNIGRGVPKDDAKAVEWYQKAAVQGDAGAQNNLGGMYELGQGVSKDQVRAYAWWNLAAAQGNNLAQNNRDNLEQSLTNNERTEGQRLASNWKLGDNLLPSSNAPLNQPENKTPPVINKSGKERTGTAFIINHDGYALTNYHVIEGCMDIKIAGQETLAEVILSDKVNDIALIQVANKSAEVAKFNPEPSQLRQGEDVIVFGYPLNFVLSSGGNLTPGTLSALTGLDNNTSQIQITAPVQPGSSGSPVMDKKGNVVAMVSMMRDDIEISKITGQLGQNVNFAINGQTLKSFLDVNQIPYKTGGGFFSSEQSNADIAEEARKWTVLVECWH